jgi:hypothetical protein
MSAAAPLERLESRSNETRNETTEKSQMPRISSYPSGADTQNGRVLKLGATKAQLRTALERHGKRARYAEWSIAVLYVVVFILTCPSIVVDHAMGGSLNWLLEERS